MQLTYSKRWKFINNKRLETIRSMPIKRDYVFCAPFGFNDKSSGVRAWYKLIDQLREKGFGVELTIHGYNVKIGERIAVYTDCTTGDPLHSSRIVRLYFYKDKFFTWMPHNRTEEELSTEILFTWNPDWFYSENVIQIDTIEHELFNNNNPINRIHDVLYYVGKARFDKNAVLSIPKGSPVVTFDPWWPQTRKEMAELLRSTKTLISYDPDSCILPEAKLCGCKVLLAPEMREWTFKDEFLPFDKPEKFDEMLDNFIDVTQSRWSK